MTVHPQILTTHPKFDTFQIIYVIVNKNYKREEETAMNKYILFITKTLVTMVTAIAPVASQYCRAVFYEPKQPENLAEFLSVNCKE